MNDATKDTKADGSFAAAEMEEEPATTHALLTKVESCKNRGNVEFHKGKTLAKHTAGKNFLRDACILYADGLQALAEVDARLAAEREQVERRQQQPRWEEGEENRASTANTSRKDTFRPSSPSPSSPLKQPTRQEDDVADILQLANNEGTPPSLLAALSKRADTVRPTLYLNLAACNLLLQEWAPAIACCTHVLDECCGDALIAAAARTDGGKMHDGAGGRVAVADKAKGDSFHATTHSSDSVAADSSGTAKGDSMATVSAVHAVAATTAREDTLPDLEKQQRERELWGKEDYGRRRPVLVEKEVVPGQHPHQEGKEQEDQESERQAERSRQREIAAKCLYRRGVAQVGSGDWVAAREDFVQALRLKPRDAAITRELKAVEKKLAENEARDSLRRQTEEGRRRQQQQQQQQKRQQQQQHLHQQQHQEGNPVSPENTADDIASTRSARTQQLARSAAPSASRTIIAGGANGTPMSGGAGAPEKVSGPGTGAHDQPFGGGDQAKGNEQRDGQQRPPLAKDEEREQKGKRRDDGEAERCSRERSEEPFSTQNGGECRDGLYAWTQSVREVQVSVRVPDWTRASDVCVNFRRSRLAVSVIQRTEDDDDLQRRLGKTSSKDSGGIGENGNDNPEPHTNAGAGTAEAFASAPVGPLPNDCTESGDEVRTAPPVEVLLEGRLSRPIQVDECLWTIERPGRVLLYLQKELAADGEPGFEWWASVMEGDPEVDVLTCNAGSIASEYPEHAKRRGAKALWEHQNKCPEEKQQEERLREARRQMEEEAEQRQRDLENALKDPKKAELYRQLRETMPDTSICIK